MSKMGSRSRTHTPVMSRQNSMSMEDMHPVEVSKYKHNRHVKTEPYV